jgi:cell division protein FtsB
VPKRRTSERTPTGRAQRQRKPARTGRRLLLAAGALGVLYFAIEGGEYGTSDLVRQRTRRVKLKTAIDTLGRQVDSLKRYKSALATDVRLQERIAREEFGMVRGDKEILYRFAEQPDSSPSPKP